jgi:hypothetical protein
VTLLIFHWCIRVSQHSLWRNRKRGKLVAWGCSRDNLRSSSRFALKSLHRWSNLCTRLQVSYSGQVDSSGHHGCPLMCASPPSGNLGPVAWRGHTASDAARTIRIKMLGRTSGLVAFFNLAQNLALTNRLKWVYSILLSHSVVRPQVRNGGHQKSGG